MKTLYLHIGTPKTGTSAIQNFLKSNSSRLLEHSYCFPSFPFSYNSIPDRRNGHFLVLTKSNYTTDADGAAEPVDKWNENLAAGLNVIHQKFSASDNVILSEEELWNAICYSPKSFLEFLPEDAAKNNYRIRIVVYLRRQDLFLTSLWNQKIKVARTDQTLHDYLNDIVREKPLYADYYHTLRKAADVLGTENVIVRRYEPSSWVNQSICADFLDAIGLDPSFPFEVPEAPVNFSLSGNMAEIRRMVNSAEFLTYEEKRQFSVFTRKLPQDERSAHVYQHLSAQEANEFLTQFKECNDRVAKEFLHEEVPLFSDESKEQPDWRPDNEFMMADTTRFFLAIAQDLNRQIYILSEPQRRAERRKKAIRHPLWALGRVFDKLRGRLSS